MDNEPLKFTRSKDEAIAAVHAWMRLNYSRLLQTDPDWYHNRLGLLVDCITDLHTGNLRVVPPEKETAG